MAIDRTQYNALVDDSGAGTNGTPLDKNRIKVVILDPIDALITDPAAFTPTIISTGGGTPTYSVQVGRYRNVNGLIHVTGRVTLATFGTLAAGSIGIAGLPIAAVNIANLNSAAQIPFWGALTTAAVNLSGLIVPTATTISLYIVTAATVNVVAMTKADLSATSDLSFSAIYPAT